MLFGYLYFNDALFLNNSLEIVTSNLLRNSLNSEVCSQAEACQDKSCKIGVQPL